MTTGRIIQVFIKASEPGMRGSMQSITGRCRHLTRRAWEIVTQRGLRLCETCHCKCRKLSVRTSSANAVAHKLDNGTMLSNESMTGIGNTTNGSQHTQYVWTREQLLIAGSKMHARIPNNPNCEYPDTALRMQTLSPANQLAILKRAIYLSRDADLHMLTACYAGGEHYCGRLARNAR